MQQLAIVMMCLLLAACSASTKGLGQSLLNSVMGEDGVQLTDDEIQNMPYASQYITLNHGPQLFVALAYSENGQQKWVTNDRATLITQHSRLVETLGLGDNLQETGNIENDPLARVNQITDGTGWTRQTRWTEHGQVRTAVLRSTFHWGDDEELKVGSDRTPVRLLEEDVESDAGRWRNRFWVDEAGQIRKTEQYLGPDFYPITTIVLKAAKA
ncbi:YjbF family lipoprotein [Enterobacteriaceae bacterium 4M9]|nr:YjbF family lipoprotein [Enterobacteriaceae bacterium 4M9]